MWTKEKHLQEEMDVANATSIFAAGLNIKGDIEAVNDIRIEGRVKGNVSTKKKLVVGVTGSVEGDVLANETCIMGEVKGDFTVYGLARFTSTAKVLGNIVSEKVEIEAGADMEVNLTKIQPEKKMDDHPFPLEREFDKKPLLRPLQEEKQKKNPQIIKEG